MILPMKESEITPLQSLTQNKEETDVLKLRVRELELGSKGNEHKTERL